MTKEEKIISDMLDMLDSSSHEINEDPTKEEVMAKHPALLKYDVANMECIQRFCTLISAQVSLHMGIAEKVREDEKLLLCLLSAAGVAMTAGFLLGYNIRDKEKLEETIQ